MELLHKRGSRALDGNPRVGRLGIQSKCSRANRHSFLERNGLGGCIVRPDRAHFLVQKRGVVDVSAKTISVHGLNNSAGNAG
jgi:hypothetical protein